MTSSDETRGARRSPRNLAVATALAATLVASAATAAQAQERVRTGTLRCSVAPGIAIIRSAPAP